MRSGVRILRSIFIVSMPFILVACSGSRMDKIVNPPPTPPLSRPLGYAVVLSSYAQVYEAPDVLSASPGYYRRSTVVPVVERRSVSKAAVFEFWLLNKGPESGWIKEADVQVYDNEAKALTAAKAATN